MWCWQSSRRCRHFILAVICVHNYVIIIDHRCWLLCNASLSALIFTDEELQWRLFGVTFPWQSNHIFGVSFLCGVTLKQMCRYLHVESSHFPEENESTSKGMGENDQSRFWKQKPKIVSGKFDHKSSKRKRLPGWNALSDIIC